MKKSIKIISSVLIISVITFTLSGCVNTNSDEDFLIYYDDKYYTSSISKYYSYNSFWYPLEKTDITDTAFICNEGDDINKLDKSNKIKISRFSDKELSMFILYSDFWDDWLYCDTSYELPILSLENIESIVIRKFSEDKEWIDYYNESDCITIKAEKDIDSVISSINSIKKSKETKSYSMNEVTNQAEICVKFKGINALYYLGIIAYVDNNVVFYDAHEFQSSFYLIYDENTSNPFKINQGTVSD